MRWVPIALFAIAELVLVGFIVANDLDQWTWGSGYAPHNYDSLVLVGMLVCLAAFILAYVFDRKGSIIAAIIGATATFAMLIAYLSYDASHEGIQLVSDGWEGYTHAPAFHVQLASPCFVTLAFATAMFAARATSRAVLRAEPSCPRP